MKTKREIALEYIDLLAAGNVKDLLTLFDSEAMVDSPIYGSMRAVQFYQTLNEDTSASELMVKGIFEEKSTNKLALYFEYKWIIKNGKQVQFDVVDIITFNKSNHITELHIIYDTVVSRELLKEVDEDLG